MKIAIIDADLIGRKNHRFPNLASEKISGYYKANGAEVILKLNYDNLDSFDKVFISKVFTDTPFPDEIKKLNNVHIGGTGFYFDKAPNLPIKIEHCMPDYHLYDLYIEQCVENARKIKSNFNENNYRKKFKAYTDYSIGFLTRGCFRKCEFCVNKKYNYVKKHSPLNEFLDFKRKKICLLDDNILGCKEWRDIFDELINLGKPFVFKQGMDERLLSDEKCKILFNTNYDGDYIFAFDNILDFELIHKKLELIRKYTSSTNIKFYVLVGFESVGVKDIENMWKRIELLMKYRCLPYIMRYQNKNESPWKTSKYSSLYTQVAMWCNQPSLFKKMSFREFCELRQRDIKTKGVLCAAMRALTSFESEYPNIAKKYFDLKFGEQHDII